MREFDETSRKKKHKRIQIPENPANLSQEALAGLEETVRSSLRDGYLPCPAAWKVAKDAGVPKIAVGEIMDRKGFRMIDCQLGCFAVDKTPYDASAQKQLDDEVVRRLEELKQDNGITCTAAFELAAELKKMPMDIADAANALNMKIRQCQLGCF